ncbi:mCG12989, isoform CRA_a, partial [Mus musculus]
MAPPSEVLRSTQPWFTVQKASCVSSLPSPCPHSPVQNKLVTC